MSAALPIVLDLPPDAVEAIARRAAVVVLEELKAAPPADRWFTPATAAHHLGLSRKRIHDLTSMGALVPDGRDGRTPLYRLSTLDAYVEQQAR